mgnify:CR=1 FL=1
MIGFLVLACVVVLVLINVPIAVALCIASVAAMLATQGVASMPNVPIALYQDSVAAEKTRGDALSRRFEEALRQAHQEPITKPTRDFDLD